MTRPTQKRARYASKLGPNTDKGAAPVDLLLPDRFRLWFGERGWQPRAHQLAMIRAAAERRSTLLIAPTGAGKTLAGFLPSLIELASEKTPSRGGKAPGKAAPDSGLHTLYISPLKALAVDIARNLAEPISQMALPVRIETRTGDTPAGRRLRQRINPPHILLTTPEQLALLIASPEAEKLFAGLRAIVLDELHALVTSKRGDLLALGLARLRRLAPGAITCGLSATVARPFELSAYLMPQPAGAERIDLADLVVAPVGAKPEVTILETAAAIPWSGHSSRYAIGEIYQAIRAHRLSLVFVNTRMQAELVFQELWRINEDTLPIALHHGSLDVSQRRKVEAAMAAGTLKAVVATSTLDLGIDWGDVNLVIHVGAPKGASRLAQRIGRANHRLEEPSKAILVPSNRFEVMECVAALEAAAEGAQDTPPMRQGGLDVLAQHVLGSAVAAPFAPGALYDEVRSAAPYAQLTRAQFDAVVNFVSTGGYALRNYERFAKLKPTADGRLRLAHPRLAQQYRLNVGTIVEAPMIKVRLLRARGGANSARALVGGRVLGEVEEYFIEQLKPGDTFVFAGEVLRLEALRDTEAFVTRAVGRDPMIPSYDGGKFPLSTYLADRVRHILADAARWPRLGPQVAEWLRLQRDFSLIPAPSEMLVESFPNGKRHFLICYPFEGRLCHQTLGMLLSRRLDRLGAAPLGFVANEYALALWGLGDLSEMIANGRIDLGQLFDEDMLGDDLEAWLASSQLMKRTFRLCAIIAGLIERRHPGLEKTGRQLTVSSDLIYDVLRSHEPRHVLLEAAWADAATGMLDIARLSRFLARVKGRIRHNALQHISPLAVPVMLEIGTEPVMGTAREDMLRQAARELIAAATTAK